MKPLKVFYDECIQSKIRQCELRSNNIRSRSGCIRRRAEINRALATYIEDHRAELIEDMLHSGVERDLGKINAALLKAFWSVFPIDAFTAAEDLQTFRH